MRAIKKAALLSALLLVSGAALPGELGEQWMTLDAMNLTALCRNLQADCPKLECFLERLNNVHHGGERSIGFGARHKKMTQYGGYVTVEMDVLSFKGEITMLRARVAKDSRRLVELLDANPALKADFWRLFDEETLAEDGRVMLECLVLREQAYGRFGYQLELALGRMMERPEMEVGLVPHYGLLTDPLAGSRYGWACGAEGLKPRGRAAMEALVAAKEARLLRNAARGPSPEGRLYALEGLHELARRGEHELSAAERRLTGTVVGLELKVRWCDGEEEGESPAREVRAWVLKGEPAPPPEVLDWRP